MNGGISPVMFLLTSAIPVTELPVQVISGQLQWVVELDDGAQWLINDGLDQYFFRLRRIDCSWSLMVWEFTWKGRMKRKRKERMGRNGGGVLVILGSGCWLFSGGKQKLGRWHGGEWW